MANYKCYELESEKRRVSNSRTNDRIAFDSRTASTDANPMPSPQIFYEKKIYFVEMVNFGIGFICITWRRQRITVSRHSSV